MKRDLRSMQDLTVDEINEILDLAIELKAQTKARKPHHLLAGRTLAMVFEKPSLRTRVSFQVGIEQLGGHAIELPPSAIGIGTREAVKDVALVLSRYVDIVMARTFKQQSVEDIADHATIPVINGLSDLEHPCQILADMQTIREHLGSLQGRRMAWIGDPNNVCLSLILFAARMGMHLTIACPEGYDPLPLIVDRSKEDRARTGAELKVVRKPEDAVPGAEVLFTDTWTSMGQEAETSTRQNAFDGYQINDALLAKAQKGAIVLHCLPAHRGEEITDAVIDGPQSVVYDEAENRLHAQKALMVFLLKHSEG